MKKFAMVVGIENVAPLPCVCVTLPVTSSNRSNSFSRARIGPDGALSLWPLAPAIRVSAGHRLIPMIGPWQTKTRMSVRKAIWSGKMIVRKTSVSFAAKGFLLLAVCPAYAQIAALGKGWLLDSAGSITSASGE